MNRLIYQKLLTGQGMVTVSKDKLVDLIENQEITEFAVIATNQEANVSSLLIVPVEYNQCCHETVYSINGTDYQKGFTIDGIYNLSELGNFVGDFYYKDSDTEVVYFVTSNLEE